MIPILLGKKIRQTQRFTEDGERIPVTEITAGPCYVTQIRDIPSGIRVQIGFGQIKRMSKAEEGHLKKAGLTNKLRFLRSVETEKDQELTPGRQISIEDVFTIGETVSVTGVSKGKGFAGVVKRHGFRGGPRTHGQSDRERAPGSIGQTTTPGRVYKGKRMAGRMGSDRVTVKGLKVVAIDPEKQVLTISGVIPGAVEGLVTIRKVG
jgi:large subunit ribosomal protein L3